MTVRAKSLSGATSCASRGSHSDVVVIGAGLAGMAAALEARRRGATVTVVEKADEARSGGNTRLAGGTIAVPAGPGEAAADDYCDDFIAKSKGRGNAALTRVLSRNVLRDVEWLRELGVELLPARPVAPYRVNVVQAAPGQFLGMPVLLQRLRSRFTAEGGVIAFETKAKTLLLDDAGQVAGVRALAGEGLVDHRAAAVVIAAGGYSANRALLAAFAHPDAEHMVFRGVSWATGDGIEMARAIGAGLTNMGGLASLHVAAVSPHDPRHGIPDHAVPYCLSVNTDGRRFHDEAQGYVANGKAALAQPGRKIALIFDEEVRKQQRVAISVATFERLGLAVITADSIEALAARMDMPARQLAATVEGYNLAVEGTSAIRAHPPKTALAAKIAVPRFYAFYPLVPGVTSTFGGLMINVEAQVLEPDGAPVRGLYAAGEGAGGLYHDDYIGGSSLANCLVMGRVAGGAAAKACARALRSGA